MDKELVIIVPSEGAAYSVLTALEALDDDGSIELYGATVVVRTPDGRIDIKDARGNRGPWGTAIGTSLGALVGLLGGPVGVAVGAALGAGVGVATDLAYTGFPGDFVHDVSKTLANGSYAVLASVWEDWMIPVDFAVAPYGATVLRQSTDDVSAAQLKAEDQALRNEWASFEAAVASAKGDAKAELEAHRSKLRAKQQASRVKMKARVTAMQNSWNAKISSIQDKAKRATADARTRHQHHHDKLAKFAAEQKASFDELFTKTHE